MIARECGWTRLLRCGRRELWLGGRQPSCDWDWSKTRKHPTRLMSQNHIAPSHPTTTWPCPPAKKMVKPVAPGTQTATKKIQIMKVSQTFHAASETPQQASTAWGSHSSPFHSHLEHQSPAVTDRYRWQHSRIHHNHYPPLESRLKACLHPLGLYSQTTINKPKHSIIWYTGIEEYREEKLLKKQSKSGRSEDLSSKARFHELSKGWGVREWKQMDFK